MSLIFLPLLLIAICVPAFVLEPSCREMRAYWREYARRNNNVKLIPKLTEKCRAEADKLAGKLPG